MNTEKDLATMVAEKEAEIENYKDVLDRYGHGRWYNYGKRRLEELETELKVIKDEADRGSGD